MIGLLQVTVDLEAALGASERWGRAGAKRGWRRPGLGRALPVATAPPDGGRDACGLGRLQVQFSCCAG